MRADHRYNRTGICDTRRQTVFTLLQVTEIRSRWYDHRQTLDAICLQCNVTRDYALDVIFFRVHRTVDSVESWRVPAGTRQCLPLEVR